jgi:DNA-binding response OmpR family regulator
MNMTKKKILVVEDEKDLRALIALVLESRGYEVTQAENGEEGFILAGQIKPDVIISDVVMPKKDGSQFLKELRKTDFGRHIPFVVLTARVKMKDYFEVMEVDDFIEKPFKAEELIIRIERIFNQSQLQFTVDGDNQSIAKPTSDVPEETEVIVTGDMVEKIKPGLGIDIDMPVQDKPDKPSPMPKKYRVPVGRRVLMLNNNDVFFNREMKTLFQDFNCSLEITNTLAGCLESTVRFDPHLIILKYSSCTIQVSKLMGILREMSHLKLIPIIIYTGEKSADTEMIRESGANCLINNASPLQLLEKVQELLKK